VSADGSPTGYETISVRTQDRVATVTLDRPDKLNALNPQMLEELLDAFGAIATDDTVNAVVLTGAGRMFSAGVDLETPFFMEQVAGESVFEGMRLLDHQHRVIEAIAGLPQVSIAAVNGDAVGGGGFGLAMACDLRFAVAGSRFWMVPGTLDVVQDFGLSWHLRRAIGHARTLQMALGGQPVLAEQAVEWGFVNELAADAAQLEELVGAFTARLADIGGDAVRMIKFVIVNAASSSLADQLRLEAISNGLTFQSEEFRYKKREYLARFRTKGS
jgi:enoyl-CoA hydratase/carnithine racemase